ncbi:type II secretion system protein [Variovorax rhizosphaerae]|uniref:Type II secretion system protein n=1 Tax=Variovorax rhizosphaerae TaxID=1836200 RepID=A0ABU8WWA7_9BURK
MRKVSGFTLIELIVTLTILAVLSTVALPLTQIATTRSHEQDLRRALWQIRGGIDAYKKAYDDGKLPKTLDATGYPPKLSALTDGVRDATDSTGRQIYFLRRIPRDPFCDCPSRSNEQTWGLRSYASPPDSPQEGRDVFDVYSMSKGVAVDGTAYADW